MTTFLAIAIYLGGYFGARNGGAGYWSAMAWPANLGFALGKWAWENGGET